MLRNKQHSMTVPLAFDVAGSVAAGGCEVWWEGRRCRRRIQALAEAVDCLDLQSFLSDPAYRRRLNELISGFSDEEFDQFERLYTRRFTIN